ncbi:MAG TPA: hypothetical protein VN612_11960 [Acidobacteriaceae bacterium]|nr:hypothetical protein [Acidobacteriaceae bacterium]
MKRSHDNDQFQTFDLFDTLITRAVPSPEDIFVITGARLRELGLWSKDPAEYRNLRVASIAATYRRLRCEEITMAQIYETMASRIGWRSNDAQKAQAIEIALELASVRPIPEMRTRWEAAAPLRKAIVSDTYFSLDVIQEMLDRCGIKCAPERIFLSSVYCSRKSSGKLFRIVTEKFGIHPAHVHHVGDNAHSDLRSALKEGLSAELFESSRPRRYEAALKHLNAEAGPRIAGALRAARLAFPGGTEPERTLWEVGTTVAGPLLFSYVSWLLVMAREEGLQHLFFLARDGQILLRLAQKIDPAFPSSYLLASRQAWHLPSLTDVIDPKGLSWITDAHKTCSLRNVLGRLGIRPEEIAGVLEARGLAATQWESPLQHRKTIESIIAEEEVRSLVLERAAEARERVLAYLHSRGVFALDRIGIVDLGWNGRLQRSFSRILAQSGYPGRRQIDGFYFSLKNAVREEKDGRFHAYFGSDFAGRGGHAMLMEIFCSADHGGLLAFSPNHKGTIAPVLTCEQDDAVIGWGLPILHAAILAAAENLLAAGTETDLSPVEIGRLLKNPAAKTLELLADKPFPSEAEAFGRFPFTYDQYHAEVSEIAPAFSPGGALRMLLPAALRPKRRTLWMQGTLTRSLGSFARLTLPVVQWRTTLVNLLQRNG